MRYRHAIARCGLFAGAVMTLALCPAPTRAGSIVYVTPPGSTVFGLPVNAEADFVTGSGTLTITLKDLLPNPTSTFQLLSGLSFSIDGTTGSLANSNFPNRTVSGQEITVNSGGTFSTGSTITNPSTLGWIYTHTPNIFGTLNDLNTNPSGAAPAHLLIGPPNLIDGRYSSADGSIAGNGSTNPFLNQTIVFTVTQQAGGNLNPSTVVNSATFLFGPTASTLTPTGVLAGVPVTGQAVPEPCSLIPAGTAALAGLGMWARRRSPRRVGERS
jgi:hypothetical protein